ncbi:unnamed protein product [Diatraea saccharalis]|uniref:Uncharacterized protein n=1 Tax=Diatraea saccharalis TaxID=40085 RepID=A0A9N9WIU6_9NEOP|nr:unnamed protein product [Diatraea saccharalis]
MKLNSLKLYFTSSLGCVTTAAVLKTPCSVKKTPPEVFELTCVCTEDLCNAPFTTEIQKQLYNFTSSNITINSTDYTDAFLKFGNLTKNDYKTMTVPVLIKNSGGSKSTINASMVKAHTTIAHPVEVNMPRSEALKRDATAPSDDDEDETEGSGSYEETRILRQPAADPANPSSYLPAEKNKASHINISFLTLPPIFYFIA